MSYNFDKVFLAFKKNYIQVPLEVFRDPYRTLISTVLSARTRDEVTLKVSEELFTKAPNIQILNNLKVQVIQRLIRKVGFYNTKANHLKKLARIIVEKYEGNVPGIQTELVKLPGVGIKTANLTLNRAFGIPAISVDTHVHKISNLLGWVKTKTPEATEKELSKILPKKYWPEINRLFVSIGRQYTTNQRLKDFLKKERLMGIPKLKQVVSTSHLPKGE